MIQNILKFIKKHQSQPLLEVWIFDYPVTSLEPLIALMCQIKYVYVKHCLTWILVSVYVVSRYYFTIFIFTKQSLLVISPLPENMDKYYQI